jgi:Bacterial regulatory proteins, gntR family
MMRPGALARLHDRRLPWHGRATSASLLRQPQSSQFPDRRSSSIKTTIKPIKRDSVISQAAKEISRLIEQEQFAPGDKLPTESAWSTILGVSRNSVREALRVLHGLGYVEKAAGRRVVVTAASQERPQYL